MFFRTCFRLDAHHARVAREKIRWMAHLRPYSLRPELQRTGCVFHVEGIGLPIELMNDVTQTRITEDQQRQFRENGFFILERYMPEEHVDLMRDELQHYMDQIHAEMDRLGQDKIGINHRNKRYFVMNRHEETGRLRAVLFSEY